MSQESLPVTAPPRASGIPRAGELEGVRPARHALFLALCVLALIVPLAVLGLLLASALHVSAPRLGWEFLTGYPSRHATSAGILPALAGSAALLTLTAGLAVPLGVGAAIYLEEYARPNRLTSLIEVNISNLAGVPSILYGLLGLEVFVRALGLGRSLISGAATLALLVLPMVIMTSREALRTVPSSLREACYALGADRWTTLRCVILPSCLPGILTGVILSLARAVGETAPLVTIGALTYVAVLPDSLGSAFTAIPIQIFNWVSRPQAEFRANAAAGVVVLLALTGALNGLCIWLRVRLGRRA
ncbi:MAG: phosphate ABC transporter permease PstA [Polyangiaceae bacterium]|nr:phosphate ABC transporter permease PstA [Polyangiaceae bacterium]